MPAASSSLHMLFRFLGGKPKGFHFGIERALLLKSTPLLKSSFQDKFLSTLMMQCRID